MRPHRTHALTFLAAALVIMPGSWLAASSNEREAPSLSVFRKPLRQALAPAAPIPRAAPVPPVEPAAGAPGPMTATFMPGMVAKTTGTDTVALTFDDGPGDQTLPILNLLRSYGVKATFCLIGENVREHPELVQAIVRDGHTLCNHTWNHDVTLGEKSDEEIRSDLQRTNDEIHQAVPGVPIKYFRHPGGAWTPAAVQVAQELGMTSIDWDVDPADWDTDTYSVGSVMINQVISTVEQSVQPGSIVLSHDGGGDRTSTVTAYETLLPYLLQDRRLHLVPLPDGDRIQQAAGPSGGPTG